MIRVGFAGLVVLVAGCPTAGPTPPTAAPAIVNQEAPPACLVEVGNPDGVLVIDGVALPDFAPARLRAALGPPDRIERVVEAQRSEEWGMSPGDPRTSTVEEVADFHHVYDARGLVFRTRNSAMGETEVPELLVMFFAHPRSFGNAAVPAVVPTGRGGCRLEINGVAVDPDVDARPPGLTDEVAGFERFATRFAPTSVDTIVDRIYTARGRPHVELFLDDDTTGRPSYVEILP